MSCPTEMMLSVHADGELPNDEAAHVQTHVRNCSACATLLRSLQGENAVLRAVLAEEVLVHDTAQAAPGRRWTLPTLAGAACAPLVYRGWRELPALPAGFRWVGEPDGLGGLWGMSRGVLRFLAAGQDPEALVLGAAATVVTVVLALVTWALRRQLRLPSGITVALPLLLGFALASPAGAAEIRSVEDGTVEIAAGERVADDVFMSGDTVIVAGIVDGDVFAAGESVELTGEVRGNVYAAAERVKISAKVAGSVHAVGGTVTVQSLVDGSLFLAGGEVLLGKDAELTRDVYLVGESLRIEGALRRGLYMAAERADVVGSVARSIRGYAGDFELGSSGLVGGDLALTVPSEDRVRVEEGANVAGATRVEVEHERRDFLHPGFYLAVLAKGLALLLLGIGAVSLFPRLRPRPPVSSVEALRNMAVGLGVLVLVPVATVLVAVTVIGIPIAVVLAMSYVVLFYTSTLVVAYFAGFLAPPRLHPLLRTALSLLAISFLVELPWVGHGLEFLIVVFGMGCVAVHMHQLYAAGRLGAPRSSRA